MRRVSEDDVVEAVSKYIKLQYPRLIYRLDLQADIRLTIGQARKNKKLQMRHKGYPDLFIAHPSGKYHGLYIEIKKNRSEIYTKKGELRKTKHVQTQKQMLLRLNALGYKAMFGCGFSECRAIIDNYIKKRF